MTSCSRNWTLISRKVEKSVKERKTKLIETDMLPIDIFNATPANGMNVKIVIAGKTYDGWLS